MDTIVVFTPLPPQRSGIADYSHELIPALSSHFSIVVVVESLSKVERDFPYKVIGLEEYRADGRLQSLPHVFQLGNNVYHEFVYRRATELPGIVVIHDLTLHHLIESITLARGDEEGYRQILGLEYGEAGVALANLRRIGIYSERQNFLLTCHRHVLERARGVIAHNHYTAQRLTAGRVPVEVINHHASPEAAKYRELSKSEARQRLGLEDDVFLILSQGYVTRPKMIDKTLRALASLKADGMRFKYIIGGERTASYDVDADIAELGLGSEVAVTGYLDEGTFFNFLRAADILINLRYPTVGEASGTLARSMALGVPAIVHNFGPTAEYPDPVVCKVPLELGEPAALAAAIRPFATDPNYRRAVGMAAAAYAASNLTVTRSATRYADFIKRIYDGPTR